MQLRIGGAACGSAWFPVSVFSQVAEDVLHHDYRRIHDDAEVNRTDGEQIGRIAAQHQNDHAEEERHRDGRRDNEGTAQVPKEKVLNAEEEQDTKHQVMQHRVGGHVNQIAAVIEWLNLHAGWQRLRVVELVHFRLDALEDLKRLLAASHQDNPFHDIAVPVAPGGAQPLGGPHFCLGHIFEQHRRPARFCQHDVVEVCERADQAQAAHVGCLLSDIERARANIEVAVSKGREYLRQREVIGDQFVEIHLHVVFFGQSAPAHDVNDAGDRPEMPLQHPILQGLQVQEAIAGRSY